MMVSWIMQRLQRPNLARMEWDASLQKRQLMMDQVISQDCQQTTNKKTRRKGGRIRYPIPLRMLGYLPTLGESAVSKLQCVQRKGMKRYLLLNSPDRNPGSA